MLLDVCPSYAASMHDAFLATLNCDKVAYVGALSSRPISTTLHVYMIIALKQF